MRRASFTGPRGLGSGEDLLSIELLEEHARRLAALLTITPSQRGSGRVHLRQLKDHMRALREVVLRRNIYDWATHVLDALVSLTLRTEPVEPAEPAAG